MKKLIAMVISFIFIFESIGYCLRVPMEFWGGRRVVEDFLKEELKRKTPWQVARESKGRLIPIFISDDHSATYWAIKHGIKEGFLVPENTIVLNFDAHEDTYDDDLDFPSYNNWTRVVKEHGMIEECIHISGEVAIKDITSLMKGRWERDEFIPPRNLKGKDIVISICMDYFDNPERLGRLEERMKELTDFIKSHREHIKLITIAYSERWCHYIMSPKEIADNDLCNRLNATIVSVKDLEGNIRREAAIGDVYIFEKQGVIELERVAAYLDIDREADKSL